MSEYPIPDAVRERAAQDGCELTDRELYVATVVGKHYGSTMRKTLRLVVAGTTAALAIGIGGTALGWWLWSREESQRAAQLVIETRNRTAAINDSRLVLLIESCESTNQRSTNVDKALERLTPKNPSPEERRTLQGTRLILAALAPFTEDCEGSARKRLAASSKRAP